MKLKIYAARVQSKDIAWLVCVDFIMRSLNWYAQLQLVRRHIDLRDLLGLKLTRSFVCASVIQGQGNGLDHHRSLLIRENSQEQSASLTLHDPAIHV